MAAFYRWVRILGLGDIVHLPLYFACPKKSEPAAKYSDITVKNNANMCFPFGNYTKGQTFLSISPSHFLKQQTRLFYENNGEIDTET